MCRLMEPFKDIHFMLGNTDFTNWELVTEGEVTLHRYPGTLKMFLAYLRAIGTVYVTGRFFVFLVTLCKTNPDAQDVLYDISEQETLYFNLLATEIEKPIETVYMGPMKYMITRVPENIQTIGQWLIPTPVGYMGLGSSDIMILPIRQWKCLLTNFYRSHFVERMFDPTFQLSTMLLSLYKRGNIDEGQIIA